ncbi:hypothetical protein FEM03_19575 [Phragmitibacter flavus]|uniref:SLA1 homology domain-containing protein n=1 Tax=Phragmitibacter flavus TaxID=2576071 RepID=A0A5R8K9U2_9BACT|nr:SHD1 domain-containing protein [Phragmitibacter flavus]TLD69071.1 hypothetical protein FEM03_19575 [Phragmitibacter flavus]
MHRHGALILLWLTMVTLTGVQARTFTDAGGRTMEAELISKQGDQVTIRRADGVSFTVPANKFSAEDQAFIQQWQPAGAPAPVSAAMVPTGPGDPRVKAGEVVALEFPALPKDHNGNVATCNVRIPDNYDAKKPVPLLVWMGGGKGSNSPNGGFPLVDKAEYAIAALPFPSSVGTPRDAMRTDEMDEIWKYHQVMLAELVKLLPNLDPKVRIVGGFSNGAHTIGVYISKAEKEFVELFNAFVIIEGGSPEPTAKKRLRNKYAYLAWGDDLSKQGGKSYMQSMVACAENARLEVTESNMEGIGHAFPDEEKAAVKKWIESVVVPGLAAAGD